jgi:hypothetical protein
VHRWLELASACDCDTLDMCSLFDDHVLEPAGTGERTTITGDGRERR